jgi:predicted acylesterase/phospholipase RssA
LERLWQEVFPLQTGGWRPSVQNFFETGTDFPWLRWPDKMGPMKPTERQKRPVAPRVAPQRAPATEPNTTIAFEGLGGDGAPLALVMKGGGIKGLAYVGALEVLVQKYSFNWFIGTSAGAITAILLGAGYTHGELLQILRTKDFRDFFDAKWYQRPFNFLFHKGCHHSNSFTDWMDRLLSTKLKSQRRVRLSDLPYRVTVYASKRGTGALKFDSTGSDVDAAYAARCSMSIPWLFVPQSNQGLRTYDGGIQHNYPVDRLIQDYPGTKFVSLYLGAEIYEPVKTTSVLADLISITTEASDPDAVEKYRNSTVIIDPRPIATMDFALTDNEKEFLLAAGRAAALVYLDADSDDCVAAIQRRDGLKRTVEDARGAAASKRRRTRWTLLGLLLLVSGIVAWLLWAKTSSKMISPSTHTSGHEKAGSTTSASTPTVAPRREIDFEAWWQWRLPNQELLIPSTLEMKSTSVLTQNNC